MPRVIAQARAGRLRIIGSGRNRVDMVHVHNAVDAHLLAELALSKSQDPSPASSSGASELRNGIRDKLSQPGTAAGRAYFITNGEPVVLWEWINGLLRALDIPPVTKRLPLGAAIAIGGICEGLPMTRFVVRELATDHWFDITAAHCDLGYAPRVTMAEGTAELIASLKKAAGIPKP